MEEFRSLELRSLGSGETKVQKQEAKILSFDHQD